MPEIEHIYTAEAKEYFTEESDDHYDDLLEHEAESSIVMDFDPETGNVMYEGTITVILDTHRWNSEESEFQDSATFGSFKEALGFINTRLDEWGFDFIFRARDFRRTDK